MGNARKKLMPKAERVVVYLPQKLVSQIEKHGVERSCTSLSEAVRDMCRYATDNLSKLGKGKDDDNSRKTD